jgi:hypothetical protein
MKEQFQKDMNAFCLKAADKKKEAEAENLKKKLFVG